MNELEKEFWDDKEIKPRWLQANQGKVVKLSDSPAPWEVPLGEDVYEPKEKISLNEARAHILAYDPYRKTESDPRGLGQHSPGAKLDQGKNRLGLVLLDFARALEEVGKVGTFGANKYTAHGWCSVYNGEERYTDALFRHLMAEGRGEVVDPDSQMLHAAQVAWNALARLTYIVRRRETELALNAEDTCPKS